MREINVCLACDDNYSKYAGVVIASVLANSALNDKLHFYILDGGIKEENKVKINELKSIKDCEINFVNIDETLFEDYKKIKTHSYITLPAYYRLKMASLLSELDRIIYFDCDIIVNGSLKPLFNTDLGSCPFAGVRDINKRKLKKNPNYINSGVLLMDLKNMREQNVEEKILAWTKENFDKIKVGDQEIINEVLKGQIKIVDDKWNVQSSNFTNRSSYTNNPKIIHYVAKNKPWSLKSFSYHKNLYFKYLQLTPWKLDEKGLNQALKSTAFEYFKYRPMFIFRPRFYEALFHTYVKPLFCKKPIIKNNTFIVCEFCSQSHSEILPGYVKYLLDLGYHVSVCVNPDRFKEGLFSRFKDENISLNKLSNKQVKSFFKKDDLEDVAGVLITTVGKICDSVHYEDCYNFFNEKVDKSKIFFVEHEAQHAIDAGTWKESLITLRELNYKGAKSTVVNPHYFGDVKNNSKNEVTNFITIGALKPYKKDCQTIIDAVMELHNKGINNFKVTVVGKGSLKNIPTEIRKYFEIKGRLPFDKMYDEIEKSDFMLTAYDDNKPEHVRYNTTGTSGNFQLVYGFLKPCVLIESFAPINRFNGENSILYKESKDYSKALEKAINMSKEDYESMQKALKFTVDSVYNDSLDNLKGVING